MHRNSASRSDMASSVGRQFAGRRIRSAVLVPVILALLPAAATAAATDRAMPGATFQTVDGRTLSTNSFKGRPTMLWLLSTWCGSCAAGLRAMAAKEPELERTGLRVVVLRNYKNGGYPGMSTGDFVKRVLSTPPPKDWIFGQASRQLDKAYNAKHYPDIYFLIGRDGTVDAVDSAPSATIDRILAFARKSPSQRSAK